MLSFTLFADDTNIFNKSSDLQILFNSINAELNNFAIWFKANKLSEYQENKF